MSVKIYIRALNGEFQVETVEENEGGNLTTGYAVENYTKALIKTAQLLMNYKRDGIKPMIYNELKTDVQVH